jgi:type I restriction enzyme S subunit
MSWDWIEFPKAIRKTKVGRIQQIFSSYIKTTGRFPVVDQGQDFIAGYSDDEHKVISDDLPLVIFGDHTRSVKYVDFPFIIGADGTKLLKPDTELFDPKFFYYAMLDLNIPNRGYNRHFTLLREKSLPRPEKDEQRKIATVLGLVQRAIEQQERLIALTKELKKALLHKLFTEGLRGEPQKQTEIGPVPESWEVKSIGDLFKFSSGKSRPKDTKLVASASRPYPVYGGNGILGYSSSFLIGQPVLLLGRVGEYCGCAHHTAGHAWISDNALYAKEILDEIDTRYAAEYFAYANLNQYSNRAGQPLITQGIISEVKMPLPPLHEQSAILEPLTHLNGKLKRHETKRSVVTDLFHTLLHQLMTAQIRVNDLDLDEILPQAIAETSEGVAIGANAGQR